MMETYPGKFLLLSFKHPRYENNRIVILDYTPMGDLFCTCLSILFGKRFDNHGLLESHGTFYLASRPSLQEAINNRLPFNSNQARTDVEVELNLSQIGRVSALWQETRGFDPKVRNFVHAAGSFYAKALQAAEADPQIAFLHLITCGEMLSNFFSYDDKELFDKNILNIMEEIRTGLNEWEAIIKQIKGHLRQVKRKFTLTLTRLLNPSFFGVRESTKRLGSLRADDIQQRIKAAYDLRSQYVHSGISFGHWVGCGSGSLDEMLLGKPVIKDRKLRKIVSQSPTLLGLERIMRFCLLRFMHKNGIQIDIRLN